MLSRAAPRPAPPAQALYKTVWEIKQRRLVDMAADRGAFIDQSQSFNVHMSDPNFGKLTSLHFYAWKKGLKTGEAGGGALVHEGGCEGLGAAGHGSVGASAVGLAWRQCRAGTAAAAASYQEAPPDHPPPPGCALAGMYYLRTRAAADAIKFTVDQQALQRNKRVVAATAASPVMGEPAAPPARPTVASMDADMERERQLAAMVCSLDNKDSCLMCGS